MDESQGRIKADLGLVHSDQKVTSEKIKQIDELLSETVRELRPIALEFRPDTQQTISDIQLTIDVLKESQTRQ